MNNRKNNRKSRNNNRRQRIRQPNLGTISTLKSNSLLGPTLTRQLDIVIPVYAVNSLSAPYYSFGTSTAAPVMSTNITQLAITSFPEYSQLARAYGLVQLKSLQTIISRSSPLAVSTNIIGDSPNVFFQISQTNYPAGSVTLQRSLATSDNAIEVPLNTYDSYQFITAIPPCVVGRCTAANDIFPFGSSVWNPTNINGMAVLPDMFVNVGSLQPPSFQSSAANAAFQICALHIKIKCVFAGTQSL